MDKDCKCGCEDQLCVLQRKERLHRAERLTYYQSIRCETGGRMKDKRLYSSPAIHLIYYISA